MAYKSKALRPTKEMREPIPGAGFALPPGRSHRVIIKEITTIDDKMMVCFEDPFGNGHKESIFIYNKEGDDLGGMMKQLLAALVPVSGDLRHYYDRLLRRDTIKLTAHVGDSCVIETEYSADFVNLKTIRSINDRNNDGINVQSTKTNSTHTTGTNRPATSKPTIALPTIASDFF